MKKLLLFLGLLLAGNMGFAQDYAPLPDTGVRQFFSNSAGYIRGIRVDSVVQEAGFKRYATFRTVRGGYNNIAADSNGACWVGKNVRSYLNGDWQFPNVAGDTILVKTSASLNDTWAFYSDTTSRWFEAKVTGLDTQTVAGTLDSVKIVTLTAKTGNMPLPTDPITGFQIVLSEAHGFVQVPDLYLFPYKDLEAGYTPDPWYKRLNRNGFLPTISPLLFRQLGAWNPSSRQMFEAQAGDVFLNGKIHYAFYTPVAQSYYLDSVIARVDSPTYTDYTFSHWYWQGQLGIFKSSQPGQVVIRMDDKPFFYPRYMPEEYQQVGYNSLYIVANDTSFCSRQPRYQEVRGDGQGLRIQNAFYPYPFEYKLGLGIVYNSRTGGDGDSWKDELYSYRKGGVPCGRMNLSVQLLPKIDTLKIYPQPATTTVFLEASHLLYPATIRIQNLQGQLLSTQQITAAGQPVSTANLPAGLYLLSVTDAGGNNAVQKLLIEAN